MWCDVLSYGDGVTLFGCDAVTLSEDDIVLYVVTSFPVLIGNMLQS